MKRGLYLLIVDIVLLLVMFIAMACKQEGIIATQHTTPIPSATINATPGPTVNFTGKTREQLLVDYYALKAEYKEEDSLWMASKSPVPPAKLKDLMDKLNQYYAYLFPRTIDVIKSKLAVYKSELDTEKARYSENLPELFPAYNYYYDLKLKWRDEIAKDIDNKVDYKIIDEKYSILLALGSSSRFDFKVMLGEYDSGTSIKELDLKYGIIVK